jgi:hypothetical protein
MDAMMIAKAAGSAGMSLVPENRPHPYGWHMSECIMTSKQKGILKIVEGA